MKLEGFSLLLLLCAALLCPLPGIAAPQDSDSTTQAIKDTENPMDNFPVQPDMGDNTTAGITYAGMPYTDFTPFTNANNSLEIIMAELMQAGIGAGYQEQGQRSVTSGIHTTVCMTLIMQAQEITTIVVYYIVLLLPTQINQVVRMHIYQRSIWRRRWWSIS